MSRPKVSPCESCAILQAIPDRSQRSTALYWHWQGCHGGNWPCADDEGCIGYRTEGASGILTDVHRRTDKIATRKR